MAHTSDTGSDEAPEKAQSDEAIQQPDDAVLTETESAETDSTDAQGSEPQTESEEDIETDKIAEREPEVIRETVVERVERKGGFVPMALGGVLAAGIGVVASPMIFPDGLPFGSGSSETINLKSALELEKGRIDDLTRQTGDLSARVKELPQFDGAVIEANQSALGDVQAQIEALSDSIDRLDGRIKALEARPAQDGSSPAPVVDLSAVEGEISDLRAALSRQQGLVDQMQAEVLDEQKSAESQARNALARAAVTRILVAIDSGTGFEDALLAIEENSDHPIADALRSTAANGVPTTSQLQEQFPEAARAALAAERATGAVGGLGGFLAKQFGARSVAPREGDDADAVLSRAEAAMKDGRVGDALATLETLSEAAQAPMESWRMQAQLRLSALREAEALATSLNTQ